MFTSNLYIITYIVLWALTFSYYWKKKKVFGAGNLIIASYLVYAILSFFLYNHPYYQWNETDNNLKLFPFIYLFLAMLIFLQPVLKYDETCNIQQPSPSLLNFLSYLFIVFSILVSPFVISKLYDGIFYMLVLDSGAEELYADAHAGAISAQDNSLFYILCHGLFDIFSDFGILMFFMQASRAETKRRLLVGVGFGVFLGMVETLSIGLRTQFVMKFLLIIASYFLFRHHLPTRINSAFKKVGYVLIAFVAFFLITINTSRFSYKTYDSSYQLLNYAGMASLQFDKYCLDAGGTRNGDRTFNYFKKWLRFKNVPDGLQGTRDRYSYMKLDDSKFSTYVGDFALDFGPIGAALILCMSSFAFSHLTRRRGNRILFHQLILIFFVMAVCVQGGMYLFYYSMFRNYYIVYYIMFYFIFKVDYDFRKKSLSAK